MNNGSMLVLSRIKSNSDRRENKTFAIKKLFSVGNPYILHLRGVLKEPASLGEFRIEPVDGAALVGPNLFQIADGHGFRGNGVGFIAKGPDGIDIIVFRQHFQQLRRVAGNNVCLLYTSSGRCGAGLEGWPPRILTPGKPLTTKGTKDHKGQPLLLLLEISCSSKLKILKLLMQRIFLAE